MYTRLIKEKEFTFDFAAGLMENNLLFVDRETQSIWSQLDGKAIDGSMKGAPLIPVASIQTTWKHWRETYPDTRVWVVEEKEGYPYYYRNRKPGTPKPGKRSTDHDTSVLGLGLQLGNKAMFFPFRELDKTETPFEVEIGGQKARIFYKKEALTAWAKDAQGKLLPAVLVYREGWMSFNPKSETFRSE